MVSLLVEDSRLNPAEAKSVTGRNQLALGGYGYDAAGNLINDGLHFSCGTNGYAWNAEEQQTCAAGTNYIYNGDGERAEKTGGSSTATLYWGGGLAESTTSGTLTSEYIFLNGKRIARRDIPPAASFTTLATSLARPTFSQPQRVESKTKATSTPSAVRA